MASLTGSPSPLTARLVDRVDLDRLAERWVAELRRVLPRYEAMAPEVLSAELHRLADHHAQLLARCLRERRRPHEEELEPARLSAQRGAAEGAPLDDIIRSYHVAGRLTLRALVDAAEPEELAGLPEVVEQLDRYLEECLAMLARLFAEERQHLVSERERLLRELLRALEDEASMTEELAELGRSFGIDRDPPLLPFALIEPGRLRRRHAALAASLRAGGTLAISEGIRVIGLVPGLPAPSAGSSSLRVLGPLVTDRGELGEVLDLVRTAGDVAQTRARTGDVTVDELLPELLLARSPQLARLLADQVLAPLAAHDGRNGGQLLATLSTYVLCRTQRTPAAERLHVHPNTLDNRLHRVRELTGLDLRRPDDLARAVLALRLPAERRP